MNRKELVSAVAEHAGSSNSDADRFVDALEKTLVDALGRGDKVQLTGLLTVERVERSARSGRNPQTGESIEIPARAGVKVTPGSRLKSAVG